MNTKTVPTVSVQKSLQLQEVHIPITLHIEAITDKNN